MKKFVVILISILVLVFASITQTAPNIDVYRFNNKNFTNYVENLITGTDKNADPWILDNKKWPSGKKIALLVHGFAMFSSGRCRDGMAALANHLNKTKANGDTFTSGYDLVYSVEYPDNYHICETAAVLSKIVNSNCPKGTKIDIFAHSMGGLISRMAIEYPKTMLGTEPITDHVSRLVMMGTPNNGFLVEAVAEFDKIKGIRPEPHDMEMVYLQKTLNFTNKQKPRVDCSYYALVGLQSFTPERYAQAEAGFINAFLLKLQQDKLIGVHDGLVASSSAGYDLTKFCTKFAKPVGLDLNHDSIKADPAVFTAIDNWMADDDWFGETETASQDDQVETNNDQGLTSSENSEKTEPVVQPAPKKPGFWDKLVDTVKETIKLPSGISEAFGIGKAKAKDTGSTTQTKNQEKPKPATIEKVISKFKTGIPIFIGCSFKEIVEVIGRLPDETEYGLGNLGWTYRTYPFKDHGIGFRFNDNFENRQAICSIWYTRTTNQNGYEEYSNRVAAPVKPSLIIPQEIWSQEPVGIYRNGDKNIVVYWQYDGNSYLAILGDSKRALIKSTRGIDEHGNIETIYTKTEHTDNFRACDQVLTFGYISGYPAIIRPATTLSKTYGWLDCNYGRISFDLF